MTPEFWNQYYQQQSTTWTQPDAILATEINEIKPGTALELGAGEGADSLFLAKQGWKVTSIDFSQEAVNRINQQSQQHQLTIQADVADILQYKPTNQFDLVYMVFIHLPLEQRKQMLITAVNALAPGGTLLFIGLANAKVCNETVEPLFAPAKDIASLLPNLDIEKQAHIHRAIPMPNQEPLEAESILVRAKKPRKKQ